MPTIERPDHGHPPTQSIDPDAWVDVSKTLFDRFLLEYPDPLYRHDWDSPFMIDEYATTDERPSDLENSTVLARHITHATDSLRAVTLGDPDEYMLRHRFLATVA